jgi:hypothetical protein
MSFVIDGLPVAPNVSCVSMLLAGAPGGDQLLGKLQLPLVPPDQV